MLNFIVAAAETSKVRFSSLDFSSVIAFDSFVVLRWIDFGVLSPNKAAGANLFCENILLNIFDLI